MLVTAAVVALKLAADAPDATLTEVGVVSTVLLSEMTTLAPPEGAALVRVTVQVLAAFGPRVLGVQAREDTNTGATSAMLALAELPL